MRDRTPPVTLAALHQLDDCFTSSNLFVRRRATAGISEDPIAAHIRRPRSPPAVVANHNSNWKVDVVPRRRRRHLAIPAVLVSLLSWNSRKCNHPGQRLAGQRGQGWTGAAVAGAALNKHSLYIWIYRASNKRAYMVKAGIWAPLAHCRAVIYLPCLDSSSRMRLTGALNEQRTRVDHDSACS
jgi:hypothetical protein